MKKVTRGIGFMVGDSESEESWGEFFSWLNKGDYMELTL